MPYRGEEMPQENGCWQLDDWGFMAEDGGLLLAYDEPGAAVVRGICTEIPRSARVEFSTFIVTESRKWRFLAHKT
jgi:hypothetical protein